MEFKFLGKEKHHPLIDYFYEFTLSEESLPFKTIILPINATTISYIYGEGQTVVKNGVETILQGLMLTGQFYGSYDFNVTEVGLNLGFNLKATALYSILGTDISKLSNKHSKLESLHPVLYNKLKPLFLSHHEFSPTLMNGIYQVFDELDLHQDENIKHIDKAIDFIHEHNGMVKVNDLLEVVPFSQKSLETQFKKIIGLTPGRYIRQLKFTNLMQKYESQKTDLTKLIDLFEYYDLSHLSRDFKFFLNETPKSFFKVEYPLLEKYLGSQDKNE